MLALSAAGGTPGVPAQQPLLRVVALAPGLSREAGAGEGANACLVATPGGVSTYESCSGLTSGCL